MTTAEIRNELLSLIDPSRHNVAETWLSALCISAECDYRRSELKRHKEQAEALGLSLDLHPVSRGKQLAAECFDMAKTMNRILAGPQAERVGEGR